MASKYLGTLTTDLRQTLEMELLETQGGNCFICGAPIDLKLHAGTLDIDHVEPQVSGGKDDRSNFALTHATCNRSKLAANLNVARMLARFAQIQDACYKQHGRGPNFGDVLNSFIAVRYPAHLDLCGDRARLSFPEVGDNSIHEQPILCDPKSGFQSFFAEVPIAYLHHDSKINPRAIGSSLRGLVEEFFRRRPQLHVALAWVDTTGVNGPAQFAVFDGQHKAAAQVLLGVKNIPLRIFVNPDLDVLLQTNANAGDKLRQVAFGTSVKRHLGNTLYADRIEQYQHEKGLADDDHSFSERDLVSFFKGDARETKRYVLDAARYSITQDPNNKLMSYVDLGGRGSERPLSYSTIEKTFYSFFIYQDLLEHALDYRADEGANPRFLEREQLVAIMNMVAEELLINRFDAAIGTSRIESKLHSGEAIPDAHVAAFRMCKEEIIYNWLRYVQHIIKNFFITSGLPIDEARLLHLQFPPQLFVNIQNYLKSLRALPIWVNKDLSATVFGGKQVYNFWQEIFQTGRAPTGKQVMPQGINLMEMIKGA